MESQIEVEFSASIISLGTPLCTLSAKLLQLKMPLN